MDFHIGNHKITRDSKPYIIAEIGLNHNADIEVGKRTIQKAKECGANAVKFQSYKTAEFVDENNQKAKFLFDIFKKYELNEAYHREFQKVATEEGLDFFSTPLCPSAVDLLSDLNVPVFKIASGDIINKQLLEKVLQTKKPILLSTGAATEMETLRTLKFLEKHNAELSVMHCVSLYPTPYDKVNLQTISYYLNTTDYVVGFSDHSLENLASVTAFGLGARIFEKHFTLDKNLDGPDHKISLDPEDFALLSRNLNLAYEMLGEYGKKPNQEEINGWFYGRRSLYKKENRIFALRPALYLEDSSILDAWEIEKALELGPLSEGPIRGKES